jgi:hypothetical protein
VHNSSSYHILTARPVLILTRPLMATYNRRLRAIVAAAPVWVSEEILSASEHIGDDRAVAVTKRGYVQKEIRYARAIACNARSARPRGRLGQGRAPVAVQHRIGAKSLSLGVLCRCPCMGRPRDGGLSVL